MFNIFMRYEFVSGQRTSYSGYITQYRNISNVYV